MLCTVTINDTSVRYSYLPLLSSLSIISTIFGAGDNKAPDIAKTTNKNPKVHEQK